MELILTDHDRHLIAEEVYQMLKDNQKSTAPTLISLEEFRHKYGHDKAPAWLKLYLLPKMDGCVYGLNAGKGHPVRIDEEKSTRWLAQHEAEIDWSKPLP